MKDDVKLVLAAGIFITLMFSIMPGLRVIPAFERGPTGGEDPVAMAEFMFGPFAVPIIVLSTALLVALVGALVLAKPDETGDEA